MILVIFLTLQTEITNKRFLKIEPQAATVTVSRKFGMDKYNYLESVKADVISYIYDNDIRVTTSNREELESQLHDDLWADDSVTGNGSGSYFFNTWKAEEAVCHNLDLLGEALEEFGGGCNILKDGAEACDVSIRCYLLPRAISEALDELAVEDEDEDNDEEEDGE